jgi:hypothetical protein
LLRNKALQAGEELAPSPDFGMGLGQLAHSRADRHLKRHFKRHLKRKWKAHITFEDYKSQDRVSIHAPQRQSLSLH